MDPTTIPQETNSDDMRQVPEHLLPRWQQTIDLMAQVYQVPAGLIMRVHPTQIEVFLASHTPGNPYEPGERANLQTGLYCETVMQTRDQLQVPNAREDPDWDHNPDIDLGMIAYLGVPICWPDGEIFGTICVLDGKTRHFAANYRQLLWQFREIVEGDLRFCAELRRRTEAELALRSARDAAEEANRAKSTFLANMSHELRTPLNAILGFAQVMDRSRSLPGDQRESLGIIRRSGEHLLSLINNVLDFSKIEAGRITVNETSFDLARLLDELEDMVALRALDKHLQLVFAPTPDLPRHVRTDKLKLRQVLLNLLSNALKFTQQGSVTLRVSAEEASAEEQAAGEPGLLLHFAVEDTGPGIAPEELEGLFEAFTQTASGQQAQEGTGLGLAISRQFVRLLGGELRATSTVGQGSTFFFCIRASQATANADSAAFTRNIVTGLAPGQPTYRILLVDDHWANRQLLRQLLAPLGFWVEEASNGQEALELWERWQPHLIWMDMRMPVLDGYEATRQIKATTRGQATAVIALTASTLEEERAVILSTGCDDFVRKPFHEADLLDMMQKHLGVRYSYAATEPATEPASPPSITPATLALLPAPLLARLEQALVRTAPDEIDQTIDAIRLHHQTAAQALAVLADDFAYARLLALIQAARGSHVL